MTRISMARAVALAGLLGLLSAGTARAGTLNFLLEGTNPGGKGTYRGTVSLTEVANGPNGEKSGIVTWRVGTSAPIVGVALSTSDSPQRLSISFPGKPTPGVALGTMMEDGSLELLWYTGGRTAGTERWTPSKR